MEFELQRLRDVDELCREFNREHKLIRETQEQEVVREAREWRKEIVAKRNQLCDHVEQLMEQLAHCKTLDGEVGMRMLPVPVTTSVTPSQRRDEESVQVEDRSEETSASADLSLPLTRRSNGVEQPPSATDPAPDLTMESQGTHRQTQWSLTPFHL